MAETNHASLSPQSIYSLDPISLVLSQNTDSDQLSKHRLSTESFIMERGPRYKAYADLRESRLRMKNSIPELNEEPELIRALTPPKKQVKFQTNLETKRKPPNSSSSYSVVAQSVPDFSSVLRKENRKPPPMATMLEMTTPLKSFSKSKSMSNSRGSKSESAEEKRGQGIGARKSYASIEELKGFSLAAAKAINGESRIGGGRRTVLSFRAL